MNHKEYHRILTNLVGYLTRYNEWLLVSTHRDASRHMNNLKAVIEFSFAELNRILHL